VLNTNQSINLYIKGWCLIPTYSCNWNLLSPRVAPDLLSPRVIPNLLSPR